MGEEGTRRALSGPLSVFVESVQETECVRMSEESTGSTDVGDVPEFRWTDGMLAKSIIATGS